MQFNLFFGNPLSLVILSIVFSVLALLYTGFSFFKGFEIPVAMELFIIFILFYNSILVITFYWGFRKSEYAFMSPKKYKHALLIAEKNQKLKDELVRIDSKYNGISSNETIDSVIEILRKYN